MGEESKPKEFDSSLFNMNLDEKDIPEFDEDLFKIYLSNEINQESPTQENKKEKVDIFRDPNKKYEEFTGKGYSNLEKLSKEDKERIERTLRRDRAVFEFEKKGGKLPKPNISKELGEGIKASSYRPVYKGISPIEQMESLEKKRTTTKGYKEQDVDEKPIKVDIPNEDILDKLIKFATYEIRIPEVEEQGLIECNDIINRYNEETLNLDISKYMKLERNIKGSWGFEKTIFPVPENSRIYNRFYPKYSDIIKEDHSCAVVASVALLQLYSFNIVRSIWKHLELEGSLFINLQDVKIQLPEYFKEILGFVVTTLNKRDIMAMHLESMGMPTKLFVMKDRAKPNEIKIVYANCKVERDIAIDEVLLTGDKINLMAYTFLLSELDRFKTAGEMYKSSSKLINRVMMLTNSSQHVGGTVGNCKVIFSAAVNMLVAYEILYDVEVYNKFNIINIDTFRELWDNLPERVATEFSEMRRYIEIMYSSTKGLTVDKMDLNIIVTCRRVTDFKNMVRGNYDIEGNPVVCLAVTEAEIAYLMAKEFTYEDIQRNKETDLENACASDEEVMEEFEKVGGINSNALQDMDDVSYNRFEGKAKDKSTQRNDSSFKRKKPRNIDKDLDNMVKENKKIKRKQQGKKIASGAGKLGSSAGKGIGKGLLKAAEHTFKRPKEVGKIILFIIFAIVAFKLFMFLIKW